MKFDQIFAADRRREDGAWIDCPDLPGLRVKVRGVGSSAQEAAAAEFWKNATEEHKKLPDIKELAQAHVIRVAILLDWNLEDRQFDRGAVDEALKVKLFRDVVLAAAAEVTARGEAETKATEGN